jgi:S-adenosylmethionine:diacylglycerol 3-amino-3-carboxypropyl transferase
VHAGVSDDLELLAQALGPVAAAAGIPKRFLAVSAHGSGEAALALAALGASEVLAFDIAAPARLRRLVELKAASAALFGREDHLVLMGLRPASALRRRALTRQLLVALSPQQRAYWAPRRAWLIEGLFRADQVSRFFAAFVAALRLLAPEAARAQILSSPSPEARVRAFRRYVARPWLQRALNAVGGRVNLFFPNAEWEASEYPRRMNREPLAYLERLVAAGLADNPLFAHLVLDPELPLPVELLPPHFRPLGFDGLRAGGARVRVLVPPPGTAELMLPTAERDLDGAYLSNVVDYLGAAERARLFAEVTRTLRPSAPILVYSNEAFAKVPLELGLALDQVLSKKLVDSDRARIYARIEVYRTPAANAGAAPAVESGAGSAHLRIVR